MLCEKDSSGSHSRKNLSSCSVGKDFEGLLC